LFSFIIFLIAGCSSNEKGSQDNKYTGYDNDSTQKSLEELRLPLEGENVFNPRNIKVGDKVQDFILTEIQVFQGTPDYPIDTLSAKFKGKAILTGDLLFIEKDGEFYSKDFLLFKVDSQSQVKLPISHHESREGVFVFNNQDEAISAATMNPGETKMNVTLEIENYTINFLPTDAMNTATFLSIYSVGE
jgi:hypothetical protein